MGREILFLYDLIKKLNNDVHEVSFINEEKGNILIGILEINSNTNNIPFFYFNDGVESIKCQFINFNDGWLSNVLYTDSWNLIKINEDNYYLEVNSFSILNDNINLMKFYKTNFYDRFNSLLKKLYTAASKVRKEEQKLIHMKFNNEMFTSIKKAILSNNYIKNGINIIGKILSKSSLQQNKNIFFFIVKVEIEPIKSTNSLNDDGISTFIIFGTHDINEILIIYHKLQVKSKYFFQNIFLKNFKLLSNDNIITETFFQFIPNKSHIEFFLNFDINFNLNSSPKNEEERELQFYDVDDIIDIIKNENIILKKEFIQNKFYEVYYFTFYIYNKDECIYFCNNKLVSYTGCITKVINSDYLLYELDNQFLLSLSHFPINIQHCSLRPKTQILIRDVHIFYFKTLKNIRLCFIACRHSSLEIKSFPKELSLKILKNSIINKKDISFFNSVDIIYKTYILDWLKKYICIYSENDNYSRYLNNLSNQILFHSGYKCYHQKNSFKEILNEILYPDYCDLATQRYMFPNFINIKELLNNEQINQLMIDKFSLLDFKYESFAFTQEELNLTNTWIIGLIDTTSNGKFKIYDRNNYIYMYLTDFEENKYSKYQSYLNLNANHLKKVILIKKFKIFVNFINSDQENCSPSKSKKTKYSFSSDDKIYNKSDMSFQNSFILSNYFSYEKRNNNIENDLLNHLKIYLYVSVKDIKLLDEKYDILPCVCHSLLTPHSIDYSSRINNSIDIKNEIVGGSNNIYILKIFQISPVHLVVDSNEEKSNHSNDKKMNLISNLYGILFTLNKLSSISNNNNNNNNFEDCNNDLSFYTITNIETKVIEMSLEALKIYPLLMINKYYKIDNKCLNEQRNNNIILKKPSLKEVNLFIYKREYNNSSFNATTTKMNNNINNNNDSEYDSIHPSILYPIIIYEPSISNKHRRFFLINNLNSSSIYRYSIKDLIIKERNISPSDIHSPYPDLKFMNSNNFEKKNKNEISKYINLIQLKFNFKKKYYILNVSNILNGIIQTNHSTIDNNKFIVSFAGVIVDIYPWNSDSENKKSYASNFKILEKKLFLKNIGLGNKNIKLILEVRDFYTPDIIKVILNLNGIEYPFGLCIGYIVRFDNVLLKIETSSKEHNEINIFCETICDTKITSFNNCQDTLDNLINSDHMPLYKISNLYKPVFTSDKVSYSLLQNLKRSYIIEIYNSNNNDNNDDDNNKNRNKNNSSNNLDFNNVDSLSTYSKFIGDITEITKIYFDHKCRLCGSIIYDGKCPNQDQHQLTQDFFDRKSKKRKYECLNNEYSKSSMNTFSKSCDFCKYGIIEAKVQCKVDDGTGIANIEIENYEGILNLLKIKNVKIKNRGINRSTFEKYICHNGTIDLCKNEKNKEKISNNKTGNKYENNNFKKSINDEIINETLKYKMESLLTTSILLRKIVFYGRRTGYYNNEYFLKIFRKRNKEKRNGKNLTKEDEKQNKNKKNSTDDDKKVITNYGFENCKLDINGISFITMKNVEPEIYCIFIEEVDYSKLILDMNDLEF